MSEEVPRRPPEITSKQRRHLRSLAHGLKPIVLIGNNGVSEAVVKKVNIELANHELIKVRFSDGCEQNAREGGPGLADQTGSHLAQVIGRIAVLYRRREKDPEIQLS